LGNYWREYNNSSQTKEGYYELQKQKKGLMRMLKTIRENITISAKHREVIMNCRSKRKV
jgi:hypothetical protein